MTVFQSTVAQADRVCKVQAAMWTQERNAEVMHRTQRPYNGHLLISGVDVHIERTASLSKVKHIPVFDSSIAKLSIWVASKGIHVSITEQHHWREMNHSNDSNKHHVHMPNAVAVNITWLAAHFAKLWMLTIMTTLKRFYVLSQKKAAGTFPQSRTQMKQFLPLDS